MSSFYSIDDSKHKQNVHKKLPTSFSKKLVTPLQAKMSHISTVGRVYAKVNAVILSGKRYFSTSEVPAGYFKIVVSQLKKAGWHVLPNIQFGSISIHSDGEPLP